MGRQSLLGITTVGMLALGSMALTSPRPVGGKLIVVRMVDVSATEYRYEPAAVTVSAGDTVRFTQTTAMPHNVDFRAVPAGAALGDSKVGPYLTSPGEKYDLVIDKRFAAAGVYNFVCTPHEMMGMKGSITVK